ncbi:hypothetical protein [Pseudomonas sp. Irchel s3f10]|uniref:hypothetical protein n=1 Tax=Pseudomonas sp. Irchel s3f10 TaxID=2009137 RepID=UPI00114072EC|nr:hypothetical protein [Pseudomonas sp. Irchel s3f10]
MTQQTKNLAQPFLRETDNGVLYVGRIVGNVQCHLPESEFLDESCMVTLFIQTSTYEKIELTLKATGAPLSFAIPKDVFEKILVSYEHASIYYTTTRDGTNLVSPALEVLIQP